jgi:hypothetical protein
VSQGQLQLVALSWISSLTTSRWTSQQILGYKDGKQRQCERPPLMPEISVLTFQGIEPQKIYSYCESSFLAKATELSHSRGGTISHARSKSPRCTSTVREEVRYTTARRFRPTKLPTKQRTAR